jgi:hypothetical protein
MSVITPATSSAVIEGVKLPAPPRPPSAPVGRRALTDTPPLELKSTEAQSLVVGSGLIVAAESVPAQIREDLVNCTLFAQLAATAVTDQQRVREWYDAYFRTLTALGWAQSDTQFEDYAFASISAEAHKAMLKVLTALLGPQAAALAIVKTTLEALQTMNENSSWLTLFERQSKVGRSARFQVATAQTDPGGLLQTALVGFELQAKSTLIQVLFFKFSSSETRLRYAAGRATIYEAALKDQRSAIAKRLAEYRAAYVGEIALPPPPAAARRSMRKRASARGVRLTRDAIARAFLSQP